MSQYLRTLSRLEKHRTAAASDPVDLTLAPEVGRDKERSTPSASPSATFPSLPLAKRKAAHAALLDDLRAVACASQVPTVVIAAVSGFEAVRPLVAGLGSEARRRGLRMLAGELALGHGGRILRKLPIESADAQPPTEVEDSWTFELMGTQAPEALRSWFEHAGAGYDLVLIEAPPLATTVDGALLARAADGLILVAEPQATTRRSLRAAVERSRSAGCKLLGLVMVGTREWLPRWLSRLLQVKANRR